VLEVPEESLGSPENSPRVYINHKSPKHWYSDNGDHCKQVNSLRHMHESQVGPYGSARDTVIAVPGYFLDSPENHHEHTCSMQMTDSDTLTPLANRF